MTRHLILTCAAMLFLAANASAEMTWNISDDSTLTISGTGPMEEDFHRAPWYIYRTTIRKIVISSGITTIGNRAFMDCTKAVSVTIPNSVKRIGISAFEGCGIVSLTIPDSVTMISSRALAGCPELKDVKLPDRLESLAADLFLNARKLEHVTMPHALLTIGAYAFSGCESLKAITIPASVEQIGPLAFYGCSGLTAFTVEAGNTAFLSDEGVLFNKNKTVLMGYPAQKTGTSYRIPDAVTRIMMAAFSGCAALTGVTIPVSVVYIGDYAFEGCIGLTSVSMPNSVGEIGVGVFQFCKSLRTASLSGSLKSIKISTFEDCVSLTDITIPRSVIYLGNYAFSGCSALTAVSMPESLKEIGMRAFLNCKSLGAVTIPNSVENIEIDAFEGCTALTAVAISASVLHIGDDAFAGCTALTAFSVDAGNRFYSSVEGVLFNKAQTRLLYYPAKKSATSYRIPDSVESIKNHAFEYADGLTSVTIPHSVYNLGDYAFSHCTGLSSVTVSWLNPLFVDYGYAIFDSVKTSAVTLHVPEGTEKAYRSVSTWADFIISSTTGKAVESCLLQLYPNPASGNVTLCGLTGGETIHICDMSGRSYLSFKASASCEKMAVDHLPAGIYLVRIVRTGEIRTLKLIVN